MKNSVPQCSATIAATLLGAIVLASLGCGHESAASPGVSTPVVASTSQPSDAAIAATEPAETAIVNSASPGEPSTALAASGRTPVESPANDAVPAVKPIGQRPPADREPTRPGEAEKITFDDLIIGIQADIVFRPFMLSDRAKELDGKRVSIPGYMHGGVAATRGIKEFILLRNTECKFGPGGQADHLAQVFLQDGQTTSFEKKPVKVEGTLKIEPLQGKDGNTWSIYRLEDAVMK